MAATTNKQEYLSSVTLTTTGIAGLASSATLVAGWSYAEVDNSTNKNFDDWVAGTNGVGITPTINTVIEVWIIPKKSDTLYHDTFDGTNKAVTVTARSMLRVYGKLLATMEVDTTTTGRIYEFNGSVARACEGNMPFKYQIFIVHNTGVNFSATAGNHTAFTKGEFSSSGN